jgi:hypothetical protein
MEYNFQSTEKEALSPVKRKSHCGLVLKRMIGKISIKDYSIISMLDF